MDLSDGMLRRARKRRDEIETTNCELVKMDAQKLDPLIANFAVVYLPLMISGASNEPGILAEAARIAGTGARLVVADKFLAERWSLPTYFRRISDLLGDVVMYVDLKLVPGRLEAARRAYATYSCSWPCFSSCSA
jgi:ubiquinone/menaquinone biosynthesis C-methylase UbiE